MTNRLSSKSCIRDTISQRFNSRHFLKLARNWTRIENEMEKCQCVLNRKIAVHWKVRLSGVKCRDVNFVTNAYVS